MFLPRKEINTGVGMIVAPGGGHSSLWIMHEGFNPAQVLAEKGIAAFVLKNRLQSSGYKFDVEGLADMQRAFRVVRSRAAEWGVDPSEIGASGFSAGGELAELVALQHDAGKPDAADPVERFSSRPDFQVLIYPGKSQLIQPVAGSPPAFMAAGYDDRPDIFTGPCRSLSVRFKKVGVPGRAAHVRQDGHGFGSAPTRGGIASGLACPNSASFLRHNGFIISKSTKLLVASSAACACSCSCSVRDV